MTSAAISRILRAHDRPQDIAEDHVDLIEVNHFYDEHGRLIFDQIIFYDWCEEADRYQVRAWRLLKKESQVPLKNHRTGDYETIWHDGDTLRHVKAKAIHESWTQHDPELRERDYLPKDRRKELYKDRVVSQPSGVHDSDLELP